MIDARLLRIHRMTAEGFDHHVVKAACTTGAAAQFDIECHHGEFAFEVVVDPPLTGPSGPLVQVGPCRFAGFCQGFVRRTMPVEMAVDLEVELLLPVVFRPRARAQANQVAKP